MASGLRSRVGRMTLEQEYRLLFNVFGSFFVLAACVVVLVPFRSDENQSAIALILLLPPLVATGAGPVVAGGAAVLSALAFNVFFTQPYNSPRIESNASVAAFVAYLVIAVPASVVVARLREARAVAERREAEAAALHELTVELLRGRDFEPVLELLCQRLGLQSARVEAVAGRARVSASVGAASAGQESTIDLHHDGQEIGTLVVGAGAVPLDADRQRLLESFADVLMLALPRQR